MTSLRRERGSAALWVLALAPLFFVLFGLVVDGGNKLAADRQMNNAAEQAARVGAAELNEASLRSGGSPLVDATAGQSATQRYLAAVGVTGTVAVSGGEVTVDTHGTQAFAVLSLFGWSGAPVSGHAVATSIDSDGR